jgi:hypothetical protein
LRCKAVYSSAGIESEYDDEESEMRKWLRKLRGAIGVGFAWGLAWFLAGMALLLVVGPDAADVPFPVGFGALGFLAGVTFSGVLGLVDGGRRFEEMSMPRFAALGAVGGALFSGAFVALAGLGVAALGLLTPIFGIAGAGCAAGSLALARKAEDPPLLPGETDGP